MTPSRKPDVYFPRTVGGGDTRSFERLLIAGTEAGERSRTCLFQGGSDAVDALADRLEIAAWGEVDRSQSPYFLRMRLGPQGYAAYLRYLADALRHSQDPEGLRWVDIRLALLLGYAKPVAAHSLDLDEPYWTRSGVPSIRRSDLPRLSGRDARLLPGVAGPAPGRRAADAGADWLEARAAALVATSDLETLQNTLRG